MTKRIRRILAAGIAVAALSTTMVPSLARAEENPVVNWTGNILFGWTDFFKSWARNTQDHGAIGFVTGPVTGAANVAVRYGGNTLDVVGVPATGKNLVAPPVVGSGPYNPPLRF